MSGPRAKDLLPEDLLWVEDLVRLYSLAIHNIQTAAGNVYNAGGGPENTLSLLELIALLSAKTGMDIRPAVAGWRPGDQRVFVANISKASQDLGWKPSVTVEDGVTRLATWASGARASIASVCGLP